MAVVFEGGDEPEGQPRRVQVDPDLDFSSDVRFSCPHDSTPDSLLGAGVADLHLCAFGDGRGHPELAAVHAGVNRGGVFMHPDTVFAQPGDYQGVFVLYTLGAAAVLGT